MARQISSRWVACYIASNQLAVAANDLEHHGFKPDPLPNKTSKVDTDTGRRTNIVRDKVRLQQILNDLYRVVEMREDSNCRTKEIFLGCYAQLNLANMLKCA